MDKVFTRTNTGRLTALDSARLGGVILIITAPFLLVADWFPRLVVLAALVTLLLPFAIRLAYSGRLTRYSPVNLFVAALLFVFLPLALFLSPALWAITWPHTTTIVWSIALFFTILNWAGPSPTAFDAWEQMRIPRQAYLLLGGLVAVAGLVGMRDVEKLFSLPQVNLVAEWLGVEGNLATNEIAGVLTLFIPVTLALLLGKIRAGQRRASLWLVPLIVIMSITMILTQSRTGLISTLLGVGLVVALSGLVNRKWLVVGAGAGALGIVALTITGRLDRIVFAGANSWTSVVGPRLGIWQQAIDGIRDHSTWGMGFGLFGRTAGLLYPLTEIGQAPVLEDAHNLYLQAFLDFGLAGGLTFILLLTVTLVVLIRLLSSKSQKGLARFWTIGLLAALIAHLLYSLTDAVSPGTPGGVVLWFLLGLAMAETADRPLNTAQEFRPLIWFSGLIVAGIVLSIWFWLALPINRAGQITAHTLLDSSSNVSEIAPMVERLAGRHCPAFWFEGLLHHAAGNQAARTSAWADLLPCTDRYTSYMAKAAPGDTMLARKAIAVNPGDAPAYFWLAGALTHEAPDEAIALYRQGLSLAPDDGFQWQRLADLLATSDPAAAEQAYYQSCLHGDPGANGCWRAGGLAEARGEVKQAIVYYRLSNFPEARSRADRLEAQLPPTGE
ncbi:MAG: O-antigen ligase family protein [Chloroflexota bacterium]|jgi:O-antigen ligase